MATAYAYSKKGRDVPMFIACADLLCSGWAKVSFSTKMHLFFLSRHLSFWWWNIPYYLSKNSKLYIEYLFCVSQILRIENSNGACCYCYVYYSSNWLHSCPATTTTAKAGQPILFLGPPPPLIFVKTGSFAFWERLWSELLVVGVNGARNGRSYSPSPFPKGA